MSYKHTEYDYMCTYMGLMSYKHIEYDCLCTYIGAYVIQTYRV